MRFVTWILCCSALLAGGAAQAEPSLDGYLLGCGHTQTMSYKDHVAAGWNQADPKWFVVASDPQYPRSIKSDGTETIDNPAAATATLSAVFSDIADFRAWAGTPVLVTVNGDLTDFGHGNERVATQEMFRKLGPTRGAPLFLPGLGNHDYDNNVGNCANNGCARDSVCDVLKWTKELQPRLWDYHNGEAEHLGSYGYSVDVGPSATFIQLNNEPTFQRYFETGTDLIDKVKFNVIPSLRWLEGALHDARTRNRNVFINLHRRGGWTPSGAARFKQLIEGYGVQAVFAGHVHKELGLVPKTEELFGSVPVFQSGGLLDGSYLVVEYKPAQKAYTVYKVPPGQGHRNKEKVGDFPLVPLPVLPAVDFSDAALVMYESNDGTQDIVCQVAIPFGNFNFNGPHGCINDEARSLRILKAKKGTMIALFGNWHTHANEGYAYIYVHKDILLPVVVGTFERHYVAEDGAWEIVRYGGGTLDGKVSSMSMLQNVNEGPPGIVELYKGNDGKQAKLCTLPLPFPNFNLPGSYDCANDDVRSMRILKAKKGTMIALFGNWNTHADQGYAFIYVHEDIVKPVVVGTFERHYMASDRTWEIARFGGGTLDGKVSSMSMLEGVYGGPPPTVELYQGNHATQKRLCILPLPFSNFNLPGSYKCANDQVRSMRIMKAKAGTLIALFGNWNHQRNQGYAFIEVLQDIDTPMVVGTFETNYMDPGRKWQITRHAGGTLDGKVSSMSTVAADNPDYGNFYMYANSDYTGLLCKVSVKDGAQFNMGSGDAYDCENDRARAVVWTRPRAGYEICLFDHVNYWNGGAHTCFTVHRNISHIAVESLTRNYEDPNFRMGNRNGPMDLKLSSMWMKDLYRAISQPVESEANARP